jgi:two-component system, LytTR family, sensor histidine kinase AgrC
MKLIVDIFGSVLEVLVLYYFFKRVLLFERKSIFHKASINIVSIFMHTAISSYVLSSNVAPILFFVVVVLYGSFMYKDRFIKKLLFSLLIYVLGMLSEIIVGITLSTINSISIETAQSNIYVYLQGIIISKLLLYFLFRIIGLFEFNNKIEINIKSVLSVFIIPLSSIVSIYYFANVAYKTDKVVSSAVLLVVTALTIVSNIATFYLLERQIKLQKTESTLKNLEKQYKLQADYYTELKQNMIMSNKNVHDIKNFIAGISSYIDNQKTDMAKEKIEEFYGKIPSIKKIETGNDAVNALVQSKLKDINDEIPDNMISVLIPDELKIDDIDICILIGNALDNAIEACKKLADKKSRMLEMKMFPANGQLSMLFVNAKEKTPAKTTGIFKTTKADSFMHGFGIENMKNICRKYDGTISFEQTEDRFMVSILLPN